MVELSSLDVYHLARELAALQDAFIDRVYETAPGEFLLRTRHPKQGRQALLVKPGEYACLSKEPPEPPQSPTGFATVLRKHLPNVRIRRVEQHQFDRVLVFHLDEHGEPIRMVIELFGKGNMILVGPDDVIRLAQRTETFRDRTVKRGEPLRFPPTRVNPLALTAPEFDRLADVSERDAVRFLAVDCAFGGDLAEEILHRARVAKDRKAGKLTEGERDAIWKAWISILGDPPKAFLAERQGAVKVESIPLESPKFQDWLRTPMPSLSGAIDAARQRQTAAAPAPVDEERARLERQIQHQEAAIQEQSSEAAEWERRAAFLYEHYGEAQAILAAAREEAERGWGDLPDRIAKQRVHPSILNADPEARRVTVRLGERELTLNPTESLERNVNGFYEEAKRVRAKSESAKLAVAEARKRLGARAAPKPAAARAAKAPEKRFWFESFRWIFTSEGFLVVGGRDAGSNEKLVKKHLNAGDLYFHADVHGAASCVLKAEGKTPGEASIKEAAHFAAVFSRAFAQFGSSTSFWVKPEQVSKTAPSGEFVAKGSFVVRGSRTYVPDLPMEVAVGKVGLGKDGRPNREAPAVQRLMCGPRTAVAGHTGLFGVVVRGDRKPADVARDVAARLATSIDEAQAVLPTSTLRIMGWEGEGA